MDEKVILLVEDNQDDEELALLAFRQSNLANRIEVVRDGAEAIEYLFGSEANPTPYPLPQVMLLDLKLPKLSGLDVLRKVRETPRTKGLPVVILTSSNEEQDLIESYNLGANSYVRKPVDFNNFVEAVRQLQLYWLVLNDAPPSIE